jgi:cyclase
VLGLADDGRREGIGPLALAQAADLGPFAGWPDAERLVLNLHRAYADADGVPLDMTAALDDALALNGGPLTTHVCCLA